MAGTNGHGSIVITNHTDKPIDISFIQDSSIADGERKKTHTVIPKESYIFFTNVVEAISWEKSKS